MTRRTRKHPAADASQADAMRIARGTQRPGQTKEQTKLIAQGIQKGIELYKRQQNAKARELDKKLKKVKQQISSPGEHDIEVQETVIYKQHWLPWVLLAITWVAVVACWVIS